MKDLNFKDLALYVHNTQQEEKQRGSIFKDYIDLVIALRECNIRHTHIVNYLNDLLELKEEQRKDNNQLAKMVSYWKLKKLINKDNVEILKKRFLSESNSLFVRENPKPLAKAVYSFDEFQKKYYLMNRHSLTNAELEPAKSHYDLYKEIKSLEENVEAYINLKDLNLSRV